MSETTTNQPITLGQLIDLLSARDPEQGVRFDFGYCAPTTLDSYRGYYDHLALGYADEKHDVTVASLLAELRGAEGQVFEGWKGGDFRMTRSTPLWVANPGNSGSTAILGIVEECTYGVVISTGYCEDSGEMR